MCISGHCVHPSDLLCPFHSIVLPVSLAIILVISLGLGVRCLRRQLMKLTIEERSNQSEESKRHQSSPISGVKKRLIARLSGRFFNQGIQLPVLSLGSRAWIPAA